MLNLENLEALLAAISQKFKNLEGTVLNEPQGWRERWEARLTKPNIIKVAQRYRTGAAKVFDLTYETYEVVLSKLLEQWPSNPSAALQHLVDPEFLVFVEEHLGPRSIDMLNVINEHVAWLEQEGGKIIPEDFFSIEFLKSLFTLQNTHKDGDNVLFSLLNYLKMFTKGGTQGLPEIVFSSEFLVEYASLDIANPSMRIHLIDQLVRHISSFHEVYKEADKQNIFDSLIAKLINESFEDFKTYLSTNFNKLINSDNFQFVTQTLSRFRFIPDTEQIPNWDLAQSISFALASLPWESSRSFADSSNIQKPRTILHKVFLKLLNGSEDDFVQEFVTKFGELINSCSSSLVSDLANMVPFHEMNISSPTLQSYGRALIQFALRYPDCESQIHHIIIQIQTTLGNGLQSSKSTEFISQQNLTQLTAYLETVLGNPGSYSWGQMILIKVGKLSKASLDLNVNTFQEDLGSVVPSPHPDYIYNELNTDSGTESLFVIKNYQEIAWKKLRAGDNGSETASIKPLGFDTDFNFAYYLTEKRFIFKICLNTWRTRDEFAESQENWQNIEQAMGEQFVKNEDDNTENESRNFNLLSAKDPQDLANLIRIRYGVLPEEDLKSAHSWDNLYKLVISKASEFQNLDTHSNDTFSEPIDAIIWTIVTLKSRLQTEQNKKEFIEENLSLTRLMASNNFDLYYKLAEIFKRHILSSSDVASSHQAAIKALWKELISGEEREGDFVSSLLFMVPYGEPLHLEMQDGLTTTITGKDLLNQDNNFVYRIKLEFARRNNNIMVNGRVLSQEEFEEYTLLIGDNIQSTS